MGPPGAVALSGDGYTAVAGARGLGTRVFARSGSVWTQQAVLVGSDMTGSTGDVTFGCGYSISADGNTIAVGGEWDNGGAGAAWIFTRSNGQWSQQGPKLVGSGAIGPAAQGLKVALSADGNSLLSTGITDNGGIGAVWFFTRSGGVWKQQGAKIVPTDLPSFPTYFGEGVALSGDGNTAFFAGYSASGTTRNSYLWVFRRTYGGWSQNGPYFYGTGGTATSLQCCGTAMSADGNTLIAGASQDNAPDPSGWGVGAAWIFARHSLRVTAPASAVAGVPVSIGVLAVEPDNVMSTGYDGSVNLTSTDPKALLPQNAILSHSAGTFLATFHTPGPQTVSASFAASPLVAGTSNAISVRAPDIQISPSNLRLQYDQGSDPSSTLPGSLIVSSEAPIPFTAVATNSWLIVSPASGTTPATVTVRPSPTGLPQGSYNTKVNLTFADGRTFSVPVSLSVAAPVVAVTFANGASFAAGPAAPNTLLAAFGSFPRCTSGAQVLIDGSSTIVFASSPTQINFLVPPAVAGKQIAMVQIACAGLTYQPVTMQIAAATPAIFTASQDGAGQAAIVSQDGSVNTPSSPGTIVTLYGTGFGVLVHGSPDGLAHTVLPVTAYIGGAAATVLYAGEAPGYTSGLQQINVLIPLDSPAGASVPLQVVVGGFDTQVGLTLALQ